jgi:DNA anti-recombination protein RmuC
MNPYMTARMFVKFVQIDRAILIPKDFKGNTVIIIDAKDSAVVSERVKKIKADLKYEVLGQSFEEVLRQTERAIRDKKAFLISQS